MKYKIIELRKKGYTYNQIKKELNCSKSTISYHCSGMEYNKDIIESNINIKNKKLRKNKSFLIQNCDIDEVIKLRKNKKTYDEIKKITKLTKYSISKICREYGLINVRKNGILTGDEIDNIKKEYDKLRSVKKVAKKLGHSTNTISKYVIIKSREKKTDEEIKKQRIKSVISWRKRVKVKLVNYKGGKCVKCGYNRCIRALEFHHLEPNEKDFTISGKSWSYERLKREVDKCILVCSNCHNEIHEEIENEK